MRWTYRLTLPPSLSTEEGLTQIEAEANHLLPEAGWNIRTRLNADPRFARNIERFTQFLTLVGLTALLVGGVGVANAVRGFVDRKRASIATLKSLGAPGGQVVLLYLTQVMLIAVVGIGIGLAFGAALPFVITALFGHLLPIPIQPTLAWTELGIALLYGALTALVFAIAPLGRAHDVPVSGLFRDQIDPERRWPRKRYIAALAVSVAALVGLSLLAAYDQRIALMFVGAAAGSFVLLRLVALGIMALARRLPRPKRTAPRLALANIHRPGALTPSLVLSLGLGITLLVTLAVIDSNLTRQLTQSLPEKAPSFFFLDIPNQQADAFEGFLKNQASDAHIERVPMMRGRLVTLGGRPVAEVKAPEDVSWVLEGDRGITYASRPPEGSNIVAGEWWSDGYRGKPLVSFDRKIAEGLGLKIGDEITVNVLGRNISATIANLREVEWRSMGINFVMVFSPNAFAGAPHTHLATVTFPNGSDPALDARILKKLGPGLSHGHERAGEGRSGGGQRRGLAARHGDPRGELHRPDREPPGARRRACRRAPGAALRCGGAEDPRRHPDAASVGLCPRIRASGARHRRVRPARRHARRLFHPDAGHESRLHPGSLRRSARLPAGGSRQRRIGADGDLAHPQSKAGSILEKSLKPGRSTEG